MILTYELTQPPSLVFEHLSDMQKFVSVHLVIHKIQTIGENEYKVFETLTFGPAKLDFVYKATVLAAQKDNTIHILAKVPGFTRINMKFAISTMNDKTVVHEEIKIRSMLPLRSIIEKVFREQHQVLFENIGKLP